mgnify:CR=1 FL=1
MYDVKFLLIDDDEIDCLITTTLSQKFDSRFKPIVFHNVIDALEYLKSLNVQSGNHSVKFIILDLVMPIKGGFDFLEAYNTMYDLNPLMPHVFVLSSSLHLKDKNNSLKYDCVKAYFLKPFSSEHLTSIKEMLSHLD